MAEEYKTGPVIMVEQAMITALEEQLQEMEERLQRMERRNSDLQEDIEITRAEAHAYSRLAEIANTHKDKAQRQGMVVGVSCGIAAAVLAAIIANLLPVF